MFRSFIAAALVSLCSFSFAQQADIVLAKKVLEKLTSKEMAGRGYVKKGGEKAAAYLNTTFKDYGLKPLNKHSYSQFFTTPINTFPGKMSVVADGKLLIPGVHYIVSPDSKGISDIFTLQQKDSVTWLGYDSSEQSMLAVKTEKKLTWSASTKESPYTLIELLKDSFPKGVKNMDVQIESKLEKEFKLQNVCGFIKGTRQPDSFLVFTAHYDHLGMMGSATMFPGANDNASGVSMLINLVDYYSKHKPAYSVAFICFAGEEAGLLGSKYYTEHPLFPLNKICFLVNLDLLGTGDEGITVVNATEYKNDFELLKQINEKEKLLSLIKPRGKAANSDHYWFTEKGVPAFFIYTMGGIKAYHDVFDKYETLPLTKYTEVKKLLVEFSEAKMK
jgi:hypothetical protein